MKQRFFNYIGSIGSIGIGKFCPVCYASVSAFLTAIGVGFVVSTVVLKGLLTLFLCIGILGLWRSYKTHKNLIPLVTCLLSSVFIYAGKYLLLNNIVFYLGIIGLVGTVILDMKIKRVIPCSACRGLIESKI